MSKPKKCRVCQDTFIPTYSSLQSVCSPKCALKLAKEKRKEKKEHDRKRHTEMKIEAYSSKYRKLLQQEINKLAREIDTIFGYKCIDCGEDYGKQADGSHFHNVGSHNSIRYNLHNIHKSTSHCNQFYGGRKVGYIEGIKSRYGQQYLDMLNELPVKYKELKLTNKEVYEKLAIVRRLNRTIYTYEFKGAIQARDMMNKIIGIYH